MSLLKLSPESDRLRRLTRAYAAGEITTHAYREFRSQVVDDFAKAEDPGSGDDTQPRFKHRLATDAAVESSPGGRSDRSRPGPLGILGALLVIAALAALGWVVL